MGGQRGGAEGVAELRRTPFRRGQHRAMGWSWARQTLNQISGKIFSWFSQWPMKLYCAYSAISATWWLKTRLREMKFLHISRKIRNWSHMTIDEIVQPRWLRCFADVYSRKSGTTTFANPSYSSSLTLGWCAILAAGPSSGECCCHLQHHKTELSPGLLTSVLFVEPLTSLKICSPEHLDNTINSLHVFLISRYVKKCTKMFRDIHKIHRYDETGWISEIYTVRWVLGHTKPSFF